MRYVSTRGGVEPIGFLEAVATGLAPDGGLFVPETLPDLSEEIASWEGYSYPELCKAFFAKFATDLEPEILGETVDASFRKFDHPEIAPLRRLGDGLSVLELFHGPTLAFKDFALQWLGQLYEKQIERNGGEIAVLGATSGDTGAAAIHGLLGKKGITIYILYPDGRISPLQERQMTCTGASNVYPLAIQGSFDDAQKALKAVFGDAAFRRKTGLSAVNSINLARILAQCVYYIYASLRLPRKARERTRFVVPTGNFGNVLAGWMAHKMGMPAAGFVVATNQNDILHRFFSTGEYRLGDVHPSLAPSMDIQVASNFERYLYYRCGEDPVRVKAWMEAFAESDHIEVEGEAATDITSTATTDAEISDRIRDIYQRYGYICDPHTACGFSGEVEPGIETVVLATAHPAKFPETIGEAIEQVPTHPSLEILQSREIVKYPVEATVEAIRDFIEKTGR